MATALISLGSNVGDRAAALRQSLALLALSPALRVTATSTFHETRPAGGPAAQEKFLNAAAVLQTSLPPLELLSVLQGVENQLGRVRSERWGPRTIDLDLLLYDELELETPELTLPHRRMSFRRFVLEPAAEIAGEMLHPVCGNTIGGLLRHLEQSPRYLAVAGLNVAWLAILRKIPRLIAALEPSKPRLHADDRTWLLSAIERLEHDQWLVGEKWGASGARFNIDDEGIVGQQRPTLSALVQPKLLIVLPGAGDVAPLRKRIREAHRGPVLWVNETIDIQLSDEVLAAIAAME
jgi:2-amino-4-hydroxy-6-hydroxymethyldihydropteridine diphosphokinase